MKQVVLMVGRYYYAFQRWKRLVAALFVCPSVWYLVRQKLLLAFKSNLVYR